VSRQKAGLRGCWGIIVYRVGLLAVAGIVIGLLWPLTRVLMSLLYRVHTDDSGTYCTIGFGLLAVALAPTYIPSRRAAATDPSSALRGD
jgi:ABC-type lipoprotein release transport system permease subunit